MRVFLGIPLPSVVQSSLEALQKAFPVSGPGIRWVDPNQMHITMKFYGEITEQRKRELADRLALITQNQAAVNISLGTVGGFPSSRLPRVLWVGLAEGAEEVTVLAKAIEEESKRLGFKGEERAFHPHVTLARIESPTISRRIGELSQRMVWEAPDGWQAGQLTLYRSTLGSDGSRYEVLENFSLSA